MKIKSCGADDLIAWATLRHALWPDASVEEHHREIAERTPLAADKVAFLCRSEDDEVTGFAEAALRHDYVNGCDTSPVLFLEGLYVAPQCRRRGVARALCAAVEAWGRALGCTEFGSDTGLDNITGQALHRALGFVEQERVVFFRKVL